MDFSHSQSRGIGGGYSGFAHIYSAGSRQSGWLLASWRAPAEELPTLSPAALTAGCDVCKGCDGYSVSMGVATTLEVIADYPDE